MNRKIKGYFMTLPFVVILAVLITTYGSTMEFQDAIAQNVTTTTNQTGAATANQTAASGQNQTTGPFGNLTSAWLDPVRESLQSARDTLHENDTIGTYSSLGSADIQLFAIASDPASGAEITTLLQEFKPLADGIDSVQGALQNNDRSKALDELNTVDVELLKLNQQLPPGQPEEEVEVEE
jgi:hypothetical protein